MMITLAATLTAAAQTAPRMLTHEQVCSLAVARNMALRSADNAVMQARERQREAYTNYFPQVSATGAGFKTSRDMVKADVSTAEVIPPGLAQLIPAEVAGALPGTLPVSIVDRGLMTGITAVQPLFAGGQIVNGNRLAQVNVEATQLQRETSRNSVVLTAEQYYWQVIALKEKQKTLDAVKALLDKLEKDADVAVRAGVGMRNDLLSVQLRQNEVESSRAKLDNGLLLARMVLAQYVGMDGQAVDVDVAVDPSQLPPFPIMHADHNQAVAVTPEYRLLEKQVEAATLQRKIEVGKRLPSVGIGAGYSYYNMGKGMDNHFGMLFATVSVPISQWWGGSHAIRRGKLAEADARDRLADNTQLLKIRMQKDWNEVDNAYRELVLAHKSIGQSEENLRLNRDYYHAGTVTMNDLLTAQQQYQQARDQYVDAYSRLQVKVVEYRQSIGQDR